MLYPKAGLWLNVSPPGGGKTSLTLDWIQHQLEEGWHIRHFYDGIQNLPREVTQHRHYRRVQQRWDYAGKPSFAYVVDDLAAFCSQLGFSFYTAMLHLAAFARHGNLVLVNAGVPRGVGFVEHFPANDEELQFCDYITSSSVQNAVDGQVSYLRLDIYRAPRGWHGNSFTPNLSYPATTFRLLREHMRDRIGAEEFLRKETPVAALEEPVVALEEPTVQSTIAEAALSTLAERVSRALAPEVEPLALAVSQTGRDMLVAAAVERGLS